MDVRVDGYRVYSLYIFISVLHARHGHHRNIWGGRLEDKTWRSQFPMVHQSRSVEFSLQALRWGVCRGVFLSV